MARRVFLSPSAARDLDRIREWYGQPGAGEAARARVKGILDALQNLRNHPHLGVRYDEGGTGARALVVRDHVIVYRILGDADGTGGPGDIQVGRIYGPGQSRS